jgi:hypothetical protein
MSLDNKFVHKSSKTNGYNMLTVAFLGGAVDSAVGRVHQIAIEMDKRFELVAGCFSRNVADNFETARQYGIDKNRVYKS